MRIRTGFTRKSNIPKHNDAIDDSEPNRHQAREHIHPGRCFRLDGSGTDEVNDVPGCDDACGDEEVVGTVEGECGCCCYCGADGYDEGCEAEARGVFFAAVIEGHRELNFSHGRVEKRWSVVPAWVQCAAYDLQFFLLSRSWASIFLVWQSASICFFAKYQHATRQSANKIVSDFQTPPKLLPITAHCRRFSRLQIIETPNGMWVM
jgi:hypothetical protein